MFMISFMIGLIIVISSIFVLRNEINRAYIKRAQIVEQAKVYKQTDLFVMLENLEISFQEMNNSFYDIIGDLEGNVSLNQKEIENIHSVLEELQKKQLTIHNDMAVHVSKESEQHSDVVKNLRHMAKIKEDKAQMEQAKVALNQDNDITRDIPVNILKEEIENNQINATLTSPQNDQKSNDNKELQMTQIVLLRSQGYSLTEIAKQLGIGMGEIKLLIRMNDKK